jgi:hypothetical protein
MDATLEVIRHNMDETHAQLSDKLESLEQQVSETVQSTGTAVNATVEAVQETVQTVTGAVQDAVQSVSNAFDLRRHADRHPWLILGGSFALGCLAVEYLSGAVKKTGRSPETGAAPSPAGGDAGFGNGQPSAESAANAAGMAAAHESGLKSLSWHQLRSAAIGTIFAIVQEAVVLSLPLVIGYMGRDGKAAKCPDIDIKVPNGAGSTPQQAGTAQTIHE